jgi:glycine/D-amino acid oxidase-like deaminating enzyme
MDEYMLYASTAETVGVPYEWLTPDQIKERWPLVRTEDLKGAIYHPTDGYINPADVTMAMAKGARQRGVEIERKWQVDGYRLDRGSLGRDLHQDGREGRQPRPSDEQVEIRAEHVVTATGNHAQRTAKLLGIKIPAIPVEHQYIVTEPDPALVEWRKENPEHPVLRDADAKWYVREERGGWILGPYERNGRARAVRIRRARQLPRRPLPARSRADRGRIHVDDPPHSVLGDGGAEGRLQRPDLLHARRQPAGRPRAGPAQHVAGRGLLLRDHRGGRHRATTSRR